MKSFFFIKVAVIILLFATITACAIELAAPSPLQSAHSGRGGTKSLPKATGVFHVPEMAAAAYTVRDGTISFLSQTPINTIQATNRSMDGSLNLATGDISIAFEMKQFTFPERLMQEHFNNDFVHSDQYPTAGFAGNIVQKDSLGLATDGSHSVMVNGKITLHGVTQLLNTEIVLEKRGDHIHAVCLFPLKPEDFRIEVPEILRFKIAETVTVSADLNLHRQAQK